MELMNEILAILWTWKAWIISATIIMFGWSMLKKMGEESMAGIIRVIILTIRRTVRFGWGHKVAFLFISGCLSLNVMMTKIVWRNQGYFTSWEKREKQDVSKWQINDRVIIRRPICDAEGLMGALAGKSTDDKDGHLWKVRYDARSGFEPGTWWKIEEFWDGELENIDRK